jgi:hypothetical protein
MIEISKKKKKKKKYKISFCITCMGRKNHLEKTLLKNINNSISHKNVEFVLLDYNSKDGLDRWIYDNFRDFISTGILRYCKTTEPEYFKMAHAKNVAHKLATGDILCNLDADNFVYSSFVDYVNKVFNNKSRIVLCIMDSFIKNKKDLIGGVKGRIVVRKEDFYCVKGYNEICGVWGNDDHDFIRRLAMSGCKKKPIYSSFLSSICHNHKIRFENYDIDKNYKNPSFLARHTNKKLLRYIRSNGFVANLNRHWGKAIVNVNFKKNISI